VRIIFSDNAWEDYLYWTNADPKTLKRLIALIEECRRTPFQGTGKPEPLRGDLQGWWSRRLTQTDRVSGKTPSQDLEIAQCRLHY